MPRGKKKSEQKENKPVYDSDDLEKYSLDLMHDFMRAKEDVIAISYRVPTSNLAREDIVRQYKSRAITALQDHARNRGMLISVQHIKFDVLPQGYDSIIKAFAFKRDAVNSSTREPVVEQRRRDDPFGWDVRVPQ